MSKQDVGECHLLNAGSLQTRPNRKDDCKSVQAEEASIGDPRVMENPLLLLPPGAARAALSKLWMANSHLFPGALALATTLRLYLDDHGLTIPDMVDVCHRLLAPERRATHRFASDLIADLSGLVAEVLKRRAAQERQDERKRLDHKERTEAIRGCDLGTFLRGIGQEKRS